MDEVQRFEKDQQYRAAMFLATAVDEEATKAFLQKVPFGLVPVLFIFELDNEKKCDHVMFLEGLTLVKGENEFLYAPYSAFTVKDVYIPEKIHWTNPVKITLLVAPDNQQMSEE